MNHCARLDVFHRGIAALVDADRLAQRLARQDQAALAQELLDPAARFRDLQPGKLAG